MAALDIALRGGLRDNEDLELIHVPVTAPMTDNNEISCAPMCLAMNRRCSDIDHVRWRRHTVILKFAADHLQPNCFLCLGFDDK